MPRGLGAGRSGGGFPSLRVAMSNEDGSLRSAPWRDLGSDVTVRSPCVRKLLRMNTPFRLAHLTDTHMLAPGQLHYGKVDTHAALATALDAIAGTHLDALVFSGDISDDGTPESYQAFLSLAEPAADRHGALLVTAMGNHDQRAGFRQVLRGGQPDHPETEGDEPLTQVHATSQGLRFVVLDSSVPRAGYGRIGRVQLEWLRSQLVSPAPGGTAVVVHHPPIPAHTDLLSALCLEDGDELVDVLTGSDVRVVLSGHYHHSLISLAGGVPVVVGAATSNRAVVAADPAVESAVVGVGVTLVEVPDSGPVRILPVPVPFSGDGVDVFHYDADAVARVIQAAGPVRNYDS